MKKSLLFLSMMILYFAATAQKTQNKETNKPFKVIKTEKPVKPDKEDIVKIEYNKFNTVNSKSVSSESYAKYPISYVTKNRDTLYLLNDDLGKTILQVWSMKEYADLPVIYMVDILPEPGNKPKTLNAVVIKKM